MPTNDRDLQALHYLAKRLRDETHGAGEWHDAGLSAELAKFRGHNLAVTIERLRHACDRDARTPAAMSRPFVPAAPVPGPRTNAKAGAPDECRKHPGEHQGSCRSCAVDHISHEGDPEPSGDTGAGRALVEEIRKRKRGTTTTEGDAG